MKTVVASSDGSATNGRRLKLQSIFSRQISVFATYLWMFIFPYNSQNKENFIVGTVFNLELD